jgi:hypothetical protein
VLVLDVRVPVLPLFVACEHELSGGHLDEVPLDLDLQRVAVQDAQDEVVLHPAVELVEDDGVLAAVPIPPHGAVAVRLGQDVGPGVLLDGLLGLARPRVTPVDLDRRGDVGIPGLSEGRTCVADPLGIFERDLRVFLEQFAAVRSPLDSLVGGTDVRPAEGYIGWKCKGLEPDCCYTTVVHPVFLHPGEQAEDPLELRPRNPVVPGPLSRRFGALGVGPHDACLLLGAVLPGGSGVGTRFEVNRVPEDLFELAHPDLRIAVQVELHVQPPSLRGGRFLELPRGSLEPVVILDFFPEPGVLLLVIDMVSAEPVAYLRGRSFRHVHAGD